jgi:LuxR family maltose regulon positive regulatory protein
VINRCPDPGIAGTFSPGSNRVTSLGAASASRTAALVEDLTDRELAVLRYLPSAMSQREISSEL